VFADSYQFKDPIIGIMMQYHKALSLKEGYEKQMIMMDLFKQPEREIKTSGVVVPGIHSAQSWTSNSEEFVRGLMKNYQDRRTRESTHEKSE